MYMVSQKYSGAVITSIMVVMPRCMRMRKRGIYGSVCVCVCLCVCVCACVFVCVSVCLSRLLQLLKDQ